MDGRLVPGAPSGGRRQSVLHASQSKRRTEIGQPRSLRRTANPPQGPQRRVASLRAKLLPAVPPGRPTSATDRHFRQPYRFQVREAGLSSRLRRLPRQCSQTHPVDWLSGRRPARSAPRQAAGGTQDRHEAEPRSPMRSPAQHRRRSASERHRLSGFDQSRGRAEGSYRHDRVEVLRGSAPIPSQWRCGRKDKNRPCATYFRLSESTCPPDA